MGIFQEIKEKGYEVHFSSTDPNEFSICCPFCTSMGTSVDTRFRCGINVRSGKGHCFNCGWSSNTKGLLLLVRKLGLTSDSRSAVREAHFTGQTRKRAAPVTLPVGFEPLAKMPKHDDEYGDAVRYCLKRGITREQMHRHDIGATIADYRYSHRVIFPCRDKTGLLRGYLGRDWTGTSPIKYKNSIGSKSIWNGRINLYPNKYIIVSEGVIKALAIERAIGNKFCSAASCGNWITNGQMDMLFGFKEVILFPDPDDVGINAYVQMSVRLNTVVPRVSIIYPFPKKQADELSPEEIRAALRGRRPVTSSFRLLLKMDQMEKVK